MGGYSDILRDSIISGTEAAYIEKRGCVNNNKKDCSEPHDKDGCCFTCGVKK